MCSKVSHEMLIATCEMLKAASKKSGNRVTYEGSNARVVDILAKIFYKVGSAGNYTSLIHVDDNINNLLLSPPGTPPKMAMKGHFAKLLTDNLSKFLSADTISDSKKVTLFKLMYLAGNDLMMELLINMEPRTEEQKTFTEIFSDWYGFKKLNKEEQNNLFNSSSFKKFTKFNFHQILSSEDINILKKAYYNNYQINIDMFPHDANKHYGMHVEAKGVAYLKQNQSNAKNFNIGLATKFNAGEIGCCGACIVEFDILSSCDNPINVSRTADYPENFPENFYSPSLLIVKNGKLFISYIKKLVEACSQVKGHRNENDFNYYKEQLIAQNDKFQELLLIDDSTLTGDTANY